MDILLGLDLGTTNCKVLAIGPEGQVLAEAQAPTPVTPDTAQSAAPEYDADSLWQAMASLIHQVIDQLGTGNTVAGLAVASMGEAGVLLDAQGEPLAPILTWHDRRPVAWVQWWRERISPAEIYRRTGMPLDHTYSAIKLVWYRAQDPALFARARTWLGLADWIGFCLTGQRATSYSLASRTMLFDLRARAWSEEMIRLAGLSPDLLPMAVPSGQIIGHVTPRAAAATGLPAGTPVVAGGHDHICAALAAGVIGSGPVLDSAGTTEAMLITLDAPLDPDLYTTGLCCGCHTVRDHYYVIGGIMVGATIRWLSRLLEGDDNAAAIRRLTEEAAQASPGSGNAWFIPYLGGSGPPDRDPAAWGGWAGLRLSHTRPQVIRAAMEGLCMGLRRLLEGMEAATGLPIRELRAVGGGASDEWFQQLKADVIGVPVERPAVTNVTAQGAALLAGIGVGLLPDEGEAARLPYRAAARYEPDLTSRGLYDTAYRDVYRGLQAGIKSLPLRVAPID